MKRLIPLLLLVLGSCATQPPVPAPVGLDQQVMARPGSVRGVGNFAQISRDLYRGEQPTAEGFRELRRRGIRTIVNLRAFHDDRDLLRGTGLQYVRIPCYAWHPETDDVIAFLKVMDDPANRPVFVHCMQGSDRTGYMVAAYRLVNSGWEAEQLLAEMKLFGLHTIWFAIPPYIHSLHAIELRAAVRKAPAYPVITKP